ncbi:MAG: protein-glutamate O-methyltransferase CheR [Chthonomonas sp.]|nr:protein-glutamate O-methyltransferase CheR [Chthonomonas sp.]
MQPKAAEWELFYSRVLKRTGLDLNDYKSEQLQRRLVNLFRTCKVANLDELWTYAQAQPNGTSWLFDQIAINVTELFRNPEKWAELEQKVIPQLLAKSPTLKCWSAGCSIGAEAHTLACLFAEKFPGRHSILGTDIDMSALAEAKRGVFSAADAKATPSAYLKKYFTPQDKSYQANPALTKYLQFKHGNLLADRFDTGYDLILCRNVVIYFTDEAKDQLYQKFWSALKPGGILWIGGTERIHNHRYLGFESPHPFFYQKTNNVEQTWRNAS